MIAHSIPQKGYAGGNFRSLATYVLRLGRSVQGDPLSWNLGTDRQTPSVAWAKAVNGGDPDLGWVIKEAELVQKLNKTARTCKSYHYVVSFPEGEQPSRAVLENIEAVMTAAIGYAAHQRVVAVHKNTPNLHMHVVVNRVHPETFKCVGSFRDHLTLQRTAAECEVTYGLQSNGDSRTAPREPFKPSWQARSPHTIGPDLFDRYKKAARIARETRNSVLNSLQMKHKEETQRFVDWHRKRWADARAAHLNKGDWISTSRILRSSADRSHAERKARQASEREVARAQHPLLGSFEDFRQQHVRGLSIGHVSTRAAERSSSRSL